MKKFFLFTLCCLVCYLLVACDFEIEDSSSTFSQTESIFSVTDSFSKEDVLSFDSLESDTLSSEDQVTSSKTEISSQSFEQISSAANEESTEMKVYVTPTGKRYHLDPDCGGKNSSLATISASKRRGLTPCKKCAQ